MKRAYRCSLMFLAFLCILKVCELCKSVRGSRASKRVAEGSSLQLSCEVQHCGVTGWTGGWEFQKMETTGFTRLTPSERIELSDYSSTANSTHLLVDIHNINKSDAGAYKCMITWLGQFTISGHLTYVTVTAVCELCSSIRGSCASKRVAEGSSLQLSCEVQHCGVPGWTGGWEFQEMQTTGFTRLTPSERIELSNYSSTANSTHLLVDIHNINKSDAGAYKCKITWPGQFTISGHVTNVTVNPGGVHSPDRNLYHRVLLCLIVSMCFPLVLGLVWCLTRDHPSPPPVPPRSYTSFAASVKPKKVVCCIQDLEVNAHCYDWLVYTEVALNKSRRQNDCPKQVPEPTIYSSVHYS